MRGTGRVYFFENKKSGPGLTSKKMQGRMIERAREIEEKRS